jgi:hypothetical protein
LRGYTSGAFYHRNASLRIKKSLRVFHTDGNEFEPLRCRGAEIFYRRERRKQRRAVSWDGHALAIDFGLNDNFIVSNRETVIEFVGKLPEQMSLVEIAREIELFAGIHTARDQARRKEGVPAEDARKFVDSWASK